MHTILTIEIKINFHKMQECRQKTFALCKVHKVGKEKIWQRKGQTN